MALTLMALLAVQPGIAGAKGAEDGGDDAAQLLRLAEYEGLLAQDLPLDRALCMDDQLQARWPRGAQPSPAQWQAMLEQAARAHEQCASQGSGAERAAGAIRKAMALQIQRRKAFEERRARLRACAPPGGNARPCKQGEGEGNGEGLATPAQWARIVRARLLGRQ